MASQINDKEQQLKKALDQFKKMLRNAKSVDEKNKAAKHFCRFLDKLDGKEIGQ
ncbi:MAG: hypothetical protein AAF429_12820 [Pseudomonadota bacterium]